MKKHVMNRYYALSLLLAVFGFIQTSEAATPKVPAKPTVVLQRVPIPNTGQEMGLGLAEFPPNAEKPWHSASGPEVCYVLKGTITLRVKDAPTQVIHAGESFQIPADVVHLTTAGPKGAKVIATWAHVPGEQFNFPATAPPQS